MNKSLFIASVLFLLLISACDQPATKGTPDRVRIGISSEPDALNPVTYRTIDALIINSLLFQKLLDIDFESLELVPVLAVDKPSIESVGDSLYTLHYQIQPEARWDDGIPVTGSDVLFTYKLGLLPGISNEGKKGYLSGINDIILNDDDSKSISFLCTPNMRMEYATGAELGILPAHLYDRDSIIHQISFTSLVENNLDSTELDQIEKWAADFNSAHFQRDPAGVSGSGPYQLKSWVADQRVELVKKEDFWAADLETDHQYFNQIPDGISYYVLTEPSAMISAARNGQIDAGSISRSSDYLALSNDSAFRERFQVLLAPELSTNVIIVNSCLPKLSTTKTRQALAHLFDTEKYISSVQKSTGKRITGPLHPMKAAYHKQDPYQYSVDRAKELLNEDGWADSDNDGILDKTLKGKKVDLELEYKYNTGNEGRKNAGLLFKEWARPAGVEINLVNEEWLVFVQSLMSKEFELAFFSWTDEYAPTDPTPLFHSEASSSGYNFGCFSHPVADSLMETMAITVDEQERMNLWRQLQVILHEEVASIFLSTNDSRFFISREFAPIEPSGLTPGYWAGSIQTEESH